MTNTQAFMKNFLGASPDWYKLAIVVFLIVNPIIFFFISPFLAGWLLVAEFIFTLAMALKCYPLQPGGLLAIEAIIIGMTNVEHVKTEIMANFEVVLLLMFMVAGIFFMKQLLLYVFTKLLVKIRSKIALSLAFCFSAAFLSAFLDALTVVAVIISVAMGFYGVYHKVASGNNLIDVVDIADDGKIATQHHETLEKFRSFLRSLMMHAGVGTALGGVMTMVGEPQNLLPEDVWKILSDLDRTNSEKMSKQDKIKLGVQALIAIWLILGLAFHLAAVGLIGLSIIIFATAFTGVTDEHTIGKAFQESLPFTALLVVFFSVVAVIIDQKLFAPIIHFVLSSEENIQLVLFYVFNGLLSSISDNVFVATVYINEAKAALTNGVIAPHQFELLSVAINTGTNLPSVATPNGQAAFLFLLTSSLAPLIRLSYGRMVYMALPYTIVLSLIGLLAIEFILPATTIWLASLGLILPI